MNVTTKRPLTPAPKAYENTIGRPTWSPDSEFVACEQGRDVVVMSRDENRVLGKLGREGDWVHSPDWSPDGKRVAYSAHGYHRDYERSSWAIYSSNPDGSDAKVLFADGQEPEYSPKGERIAYQFSKAHHPDRIAIANPDGSGTKFVSKPGHLQQDLSWSPGGHQVAYDGKFDGSYQIRVTDITGTKDRMLSNGEGGWFTDKNPEWSPTDKDVIVFERHFRRALSNSLMTIDPQTKEEKLLLQGTHRHLDPAWSPDGSKIAFVSDRDNEEYNLDLYVMDADGTDVVQVSDLPTQDYAPTWSPDGKALAFITWDREAKGKDRETVQIVELPESLWSSPASQKTSSEAR